MATQQEYLDDLERRMMVRVTVDADGKKTYIFEGSSLFAPAFYPLPFVPVQQSPAQWKEMVTKTIDSYLTWWAGAFEALQAKLKGQALAAEQHTALISVFNSDTSLWELKTVDVDTGQEVPQK